MKTPELRRPIPNESRSADRLEFHYSVERSLANRLKAAPKSSRAAVYPEVYDELLHGVSDHPSLTLPWNPAARRLQLLQQLETLRRWLTPATVYLEIGAGHAALASEVAKLVHRVHAVEVSKTVIDRPGLPSNLEVIIVEGVEAPIQACTVDLALQ